MERHILTRMSLLNCQVCSEGTEYEALAWLQKTHPAGTSNNWQIDEKPAENRKPVKCAEYPERTHYLFIC